MQPRNDDAATSNPAYPPAHYVEHGIEKLYAVMLRFPFATVVSQGFGGPIVTQVPLILDRSRGQHGSLFGHMDRSNPHAALLDSQQVTAIFHGPNAYISPFVYESSQLPTWNSISVHVHGQARVIEDEQVFIRGLQSICELADPAPDAYRLPSDEPRIARLIEYIVGFEVDIARLTGRFKLGQDRTPGDRRLATEALIRRSKVGEQELINFVVAGDPAETS